ncbi:receptor-like protein EIX2 [Rutidosis leptorrhynchoides]|uniref:receptor-like protein EIX2 n=1 Tax=Rutidosis leptorrhynchoides TaxID=125765 RepID=UPI003A992877
MSYCTNLRFVDIGENKLSGNTPAWVGERLTRLYVLVLQSNMLSGSLPTQTCWLYNLHILDLSNNELVGNIPHCFGNFTSMSTKRSGDVMANHSCYSYRQKFIDNALVVWKGTYRSFGRSNLELLKIMDLSNNNLSGELPSEITRLIELVSLNISLNKLNGELSKDIGMLKSLDSRDLSRNHFSGKIPSSLSQLDGLGYLDLSYNNLSGETPTATQFQRFNSTSYESNPLLYGPPLTPISRPTSTTSIFVVEDDNDINGDDDIWKSYYMGMGTGFAVGFWGICDLIFLNRRCRHFTFCIIASRKGLDTCNSCCVIPEVKKMNIQVFYNSHSENKVCYNVIYIASILCCNTITTKTTIDRLFSSYWHALTNDAHLGFISSAR